MYPSNHFLPLKQSSWKIPTEKFHWYQGLNPGLQLPIMSLMHILLNSIDVDMKSEIGICRGGLTPYSLRFHVKDAGADTKLIQHGPLGVAYHRRHPISTHPSRYPNRRMLWKLIWHELWSTCLKHSDPAMHTLLLNEFSTWSELLQLWVQDHPKYQHLLLSGFFNFNTCCCWIYSLEDNYFWLFYIDL